MESAREGSPQVMDVDAADLDEVEATNAEASAPFRSGSCAGRPFRREIGALRSVRADHPEGTLERSRMPRLKTLAKSATARGRRQRGPVDRIEMQRLSAAMEATTARNPIATRRSGAP